MSDLSLAGLFLLGSLLGVLIGWASWRLPILIAIDRGLELDEDGYTIIKKSELEQLKAQANK